MAADRTEQISRLAAANIVRRGGCRCGGDYCEHDYLDILDAIREARREAFREAAEIATKAAWEGINDARWIAAAIEKESQS